MNKTPLLICAASLAAAPLFLTAPASANGKHRLNANLNLTFAGVGVGRLKNELIINGDNYVIGGVARTNKIVSIIAKTDAKFHSIGTFSGSKVIPSSHSLTYSGKKSGSVAFKFGGGNLISSSVSPKVNYGATAIPVSATHLNAILDPVSVALFPVAANQIGNGPAICNRTMDVYDGKNRFRLNFRYVSKQYRKAKGFKGQTFTCAVRYVPVAGHTPSKKTVKFMQANTSMRVIVARAGNSRVYSLYGFKVKTTKGTAAGMAYRFSH